MNKIINYTNSFLALILVMVVVFVSLNAYNKIFKFGESDSLPGYLIHPQNRLVQKVDYIVESPSLVINSYNIDQATLSEGVEYELGGYYLNTVTNEFADWKLDSTMINDKSFISYTNENGEINRYENSSWVSDSNIAELININGQVSGDFSAIIVDDQLITERLFLEIPVNE